MRAVANYFLLLIIVIVFAFVITKIAAHLNIVPDSKDFRIGLAVGLAPFIILLAEKVNLLKKKDN